MTDPATPAVDGGLAGLLKDTLGRLPALAAAYGATDGTRAVAVTGRRRTDSGDSVMPQDRWHLGSVTKSMTALLLATLAEDGRLGPDDPVARHLPAHPGWRDVSFRDLMAHRGGLPANPPLRDLFRPPEGEDARAGIARAALSRPPGRRRFRYSILGYIVLGGAIEAVTGESWEAAMRRRLFGPLGLASAGFGAPGDAAPWGHLGLFGLLRLSRDPGRTRADNPAFLGPAGTVHMSIADFAAYARHLCRLIGGHDGIVAARTYADLIRPHGGPGPFGEYGGGLIAAPPQGTLPAHRWHNGSNRFWMAHMTLVPATGRFTVVCTNIGGTLADLRTARLARHLAMATNT